ncbi:MAG: hypothetical protein GX121_09645 [Ignavibacteria bacterium]|nr:hypothetical protein [Ignavibacteria bacterium]
MNSILAALEKKYFLIKMYQRKNILLFIAVFVVFLYYESHSQCNCLGSGLGGGLNQPAGTTSRGILPQSNFRLQALYKHRSGDEFFSKDINQGKGFINNFQSDYLGILLGYGFSHKLTVEAEFAFFPNHKVDYYYKSVNEFGSPSFYLSGKYNVYSSYFKKFEFTAGAGLKTAFQPFNYGLLLHSFLHKGFGENALDFYMISRAELNAKNHNDFQQGHNLSNSFFLTKNVFEDLLAIAELRADFAVKDYQGKRSLDSTGFFVLTIAPQIVYSFSDFYVSALFDLPVYRYFNGSQIATRNPFAISLGWQFD